MRGALKFSKENLCVGMSAYQVMIHISIFVAQDLLVGFAALFDHTTPVFVEDNCKT